MDSIEPKLILIPSRGYFKKPEVLTIPLEQCCESIEKFKEI